MPYTNSVKESKMGCKTGWNGFIQVSSATSPKRSFKVAVVSTASHLAYSVRLYKKRIPLGVNGVSVMM